MSPYRIEGPALISFSGGRTSGYMLKQMIDAWGGALPDDVIPVFANTGKERPETLDFVRDCGERWGVKIVWLEWRDGPSKQRFIEVSHEAASRNGEPFTALIDKKGYLPNPVTRFCTSELKIRVMRDFAMSLGWTNWTNVIGLRADEPRRVAKSRNNRDRWDNATPLSAAMVTKADVAEFWQSQPFDLALENVGGKTPAGNCDLCFLKGAATISGLIAQDPALADWWIATEAASRASRASGGTFRKDRPNYAALKRAVLAQMPLDFGDMDTLDDCACTE
jgi:3'-phosphoadenosine 5'-phosphosulfate sulfotransferase (PAPS reductase)/FAD synthetase